MPKRRSLNREKVIAQAIHLANDAGTLDAVSLKSLADALKIQPPSLYNHVSNVHDLHRGITLYGLQHLFAEMKHAAAGLLGREAITAVAHAYRTFAHQQPGIYPLLLRAPNEADETHSQLSKEMIQFLALLLGTMGVNGDQSIHAIRGLRAILHGFVSLEMADGFKMPLSTESSFDNLIETFLDGLA